MRATRVPGIDSLRGAAVIAMVFTHSARVVPRSGTATLDLHGWLSGIEPAISGCFLGLVGWSLANSCSNSHRLGGGVWYRRAFRRALSLYVCGAVLFALQHGPNFPDLVLSPDILSVIAWAVVVVGACVWAWPRAHYWVAAAVLGGAFALEASDTVCSGLNSGPGGAIPLLAFAAFGAGLRQGEPDSGSWVAWAMGASLLLGLAGPLAGPLVEQHASRYVAPNGAITTVWFWNHTVRGVLVLLGPVMGLLLVARRLPQSRWTGALELMGRHALVAYVGHLLVLGVVDRYWSLPRGAGPLALCTAALLCGVLMVALVLESHVFARSREFLHARLGLSL